MAWDDDDDEWGKSLSDDPEAVERRRQARVKVDAARRRALRWAYAALGLLLVVVIVVALTR